MILVTGVTGSGKTSTMAAMVHHINQTQHKHILTLENPIEFLHRDINCSVTQREIGTDTDDFRMGLRAALRQDPDVVLIGEMRDAETIDTAMKAAETGHLLISTLHTPDAVSTVNRDDLDVPGGGAGDRPAAPGRVAAGGGVAAPAAPGRRRRTRRRHRGAARDGDGAGHDPRPDAHAGVAPITSANRASSTACRRSTSTSWIW